MKVGIYCRLSREDEDKTSINSESESIQNQKTMLINYSLEKNWEIYKIYCDEDYSGADINRPEFNQLIFDAKNHKFDIVLCKTQSRFTRDMEIVEKYLHNKFILWNIRFVSLVDNVDTLDKANKKSRQINGLVNEWYLEDLSENIKKTFDSKRKQGLHIGSFVCYGYTKDLNNKNKIIIDNEASKIVKYIFDLYENGNSINQISKILTNKNISIPTLYKQEHGFNFKNNNTSVKNIWSYSTITKILKNQMYIGNMVQGYNRKISYKSNKSSNVPYSDLIIVKNTHKPIISKEQFQKVQNKLNSQKKSCNTATTHIFSNKIYCLDCKSKLYKCTNSKSYIFFSCSKSKFPNKTCTSHSIGLENLKNIVLKDLKIYINKYFDIKYINDTLSSTSTPYFEKLQFLNKQNNELQNNLDKITYAIKKLYLDKFNGKLDDILFNNLFLSLKKDLESSQKKQNEIIEKIKKLKNLQSINPIFFNIENKIKKLDFNVYDLIYNFVNYIEIGEKELISNTQKVIIHWNF